MEERENTSIRPFFQGLWPLVLMLGVSLGASPTSVDAVPFGYDKVATVGVDSGYIRSAVVATSPYNVERWGGSVSSVTRDPRAFTTHLAPSVATNSGSGASSAANGARLNSRLRVHHRVKREV